MPDAKKRKRLGFISLIALLAIPTLGVGMVVNGIDGAFTEYGDQDAAQAIFNVAYNIEGEKERMGGQDTGIVHLEDLETIQRLPTTMLDESIKQDGFRKYYIAEDSVTSDYCIMVEQSYGEEAREGIVYSSASDLINTLEKSDCSLDEFVQVAGPKQEIEPKEETDSDPFGEAWPFALVPGGYALIALGKRAFAAPAPKPAKEIEDKPKPTIMGKIAIAKFRGELSDRVNEIVKKWSEYETDPVKVLDYPMVANMSFGPTSDFHLAMIRAKSAASSKTIDIREFEDMVTALEHAYEVMIAEAQRMKWSSFSADEQRHLRKAQSLLQMAFDASASVHERNAAYKRLLKEVEGILSLSPITMMVIENKATLRIEA